eukprot:340629-Hanusia_phi.AAC.5
MKSVTVTVTKNQGPASQSQSDRTLASPGRAPAWCRGRRHTGAPAGSQLDKLTQRRGGAPAGCTQAGCRVGQCAARPRTEPGPGGPPRWPGNLPQAVHGW